MLIESLSIGSGLFSLSTRLLIRRSRKKGKKQLEVLFVLQRVTKLWRKAFPLFMMMSSRMMLHRTY